MIYGLVNNYAPLENNAPLAAPFQGIELLYSGIPSERRLIMESPMAQRIHKKIELKMTPKGSYTPKNKKTSVRLKFFIS